MPPEKNPKEDAVCDGPGPSQRKKKRLAKLKRYVRTYYVNFAEPVSKIGSPPMFQPLRAHARLSRMLPPPPCFMSQSV